MEASIEMLESGAAEIGEVSATGKITDYTVNTVAHYKRTIESLQKLIASLEARD
jgi:hypothetical protein